MPQAPASPSTPSPWPFSGSQPRASLVPLRDRALGCWDLVAAEAAPGGTRKSYVNEVQGSASSPTPTSVFLAAAREPFKTQTEPQLAWPSLLPPSGPISIVTSARKLPGPAAWPLSAPSRQHCPSGDELWTAGSSQWGRELSPGSRLPEHDRCPRMPAPKSQPLRSGQAPGSFGFVEGHLATDADILGAKWRQVSPPSVSHVIYCSIFT